MQKDEKLAAGAASDLSGLLDCYFNQITESLKKYHRTRVFEVPLCFSRGFNDFVETNNELQLGGFVDNKTHCYVHLDKNNGDVKRYYNGIAI